MSSRRSLIFLISALFIFPSSALAMTLEQYLAQVVQKHRGLEGLRGAQEAAVQARVSGDIELAPRLHLTGGYLSDKKQPATLGAEETRSEFYNLSLSKLFSTGTQVAVTAKTMGLETLGVNLPAGFGDLFPTNYAQGGLGIELSQSLWKNAFGRSTRLRRDRQMTLAEAEVGGHDLQSRQILAGAEIAFWDLLYLQEEVTLRESSLARGKKLEAWFRRRAGDGISDRTDVLNAEALVAARDLQLASSKDLLVAAEKNLRMYLEIPDGEALPKLQGVIAQIRDPQSFVEKEGRVVRLDAHLASLKAKTQEIAAKEVEEGTRADLVLKGSYFTNSYEPGGEAIDGTKEWHQTDHPTTQVSLSWTYLFETDAKKASVGAARGQARVARLQAERAGLESESAWSEMIRRHGELSHQIKAAEALQKIQSNLAKALQDKYSRGRAMTSDVISSEESAAEAELRLTKMRAEQRKLEAQTRLFVNVKE